MKRRMRSQDILVFGCLVLGLVGLTISSAPARVPLEVAGSLLGPGVLASRTARRIIEELPSQAGLVVILVLVAWTFSGAAVFIPRYAIAGGEPLTSKWSAVMMIVCYGLLGLAAFVAWRLGSAADGPGRVSRPGPKTS